MVGIRARREELLGQPLGDAWARGSDLDPVKHGHEVAEAEAGQAAARGDDEVLKSSRWGRSGLRVAALENFGQRVGARLNVGEGKRPVGQAERACDDDAAVQDLDGPVGKASFAVVLHSVGIDVVEDITAHRASDADDVLDGPHAL